MVPSPSAGPIKRLLFGFGLAGRLVAGWGIKYNWLDRTNDIITLGLDRAPESRVAAPSDMINLADDFTLFSGKRVIPNTGGDGLIYLQRSGSLGAIDSGPNYVQQRHGGKINVSFCDGHLESVGYRKLYLETNDATRRRWNIDHEPHHEFWVNP